MENEVYAGCSHADFCGGCEFQGLSYLEQVEKKEALLQELFLPLLKEEKGVLQPLLKAPTLWEYRNKMEFSFSADKKGNRYLGLYQKKGRGRVEDIKRCHLASKWFSDALDLTRAWWESYGLMAYHPYRNTGSLRTLTLREARKGEQKMAILTVSGNSEFALSKKAIDGFIDSLKKIDPSISLFLKIHQAIKGEPTQFFEHLLSGPAHIVERLCVGGREIKFKLSPSSFFQPNPAQAEVLFGEALALFDPQPTETLLDLYCGAGALSLVFAPFVKKVVGVEINPYAIFDAKENALINGFHNVEMFCSDVGVFLKREKAEAIDGIIVDPPRTGLDDMALKTILELLPKKLLYISCNPKTQVRDLQLLSEAYELKRLQPVDQFPHTPHVENIALIILKD